ncbi:MAG: hypothetical protein AB7S72_01905 [Draconibacterium sp.]
MTYKLKDLPSPKASISELTDFVEIECIKSVSKSCNLLSAARSLGILSDENDALTQINDEDDSNNEKMIAVSLEIESRLKNCAGNYPFYLKNGGYTVVYDDNVGDLIKYSYLYLLFLTRLRMTGPNGIGRINGIDGALLFEQFSLRIIKNYFGDRANGLIFGTSVRGSFHSKVNDLISSIGEGGRFNTKDYDPTHAYDSKLDSVVWIDFKDNRGAKIICFIQSKTGTSWKEYVNQLIPTQFTKKWFLNQPSLEPINAFAITEVLRENFYEHTIEKLFFERCRLMDFLPENVNEILDRIILWTDGAIEYINGNSTGINIEVI